MKRTLLHGLFPLVRAEIFRLLLTNVRTESYMRELARLSELSLQTVQDRNGNAGNSVAGVFKVLIGDATNNPVVNSVDALLTRNAPVNNRCIELPQRLRHRRHGKQRRCNPCPSPFPEMRSTWPAKRRRRANSLSLTRLLVEGRASARSVSSSALSCRSNLQTELRILSSDWKRPLNENIRNSHLLPSLSEEK